MPNSNKDNIVLTLWCDETMEILAAVNTDLKLCVHWKTHHRKIVKEPSCIMKPDEMLAMKVGINKIEIEQYHTHQE